MPRSVEHTRDAVTTRVGFTYDHEDRRVKKSIADGPATFYIGEHFQVKADTNTSESTSYIFAGTLRVAKITDGTTLYFHKDHLDSSSVLTDASGSPMEQTAYLPYGHERSRTGSDLSDYKFTDQEKDRETGLYNYDARLYDPVLGRFTMADTLLPDLYNPQALNRYAYVLNNPLIYTDPTGHLPFSILATRDIGEENPVGLADRNGWVDTFFGETGVVMNTLSYVTPGLKGYGEWHDGWIDDLELEPGVWGDIVKVTTNVMVVSAPIFAVKDLVDDTLGLFETDDVNTNNNSLNTNDNQDSTQQPTTIDSTSYQPYGDSDMDINDAFTNSYGDADTDINDAFTGNDSTDSDGDKIICVELYRQGLLDPVIYRADEQFGRFLRMTNPDALAGYHLWAKPVVKMMQHSELASKVVFFFAKLWAEEMAYRMGAKKEGNFYGNVLMGVGLPICETIGKSINYLSSAQCMVNITLIVLLISSFIAYSINLFVKKRFSRGTA